MSTKTTEPRGRPTTIAAALLSALVLTACGGGEPQAAAPQPAEQATEAEQSDSLLDGGQTSTGKNVPMYLAQSYDALNDASQVEFCEGIEKSYGTGLVDRFTTQFPELPSDVDTQVLLSFRDDICRKAAAKPVQFTFTCYAPSTDMVSVEPREIEEMFGSIEEVWAYEGDTRLTTCEAVPTGTGSISDLQAEALDAAGTAVAGPEDVDGLSTLYERCAVPDLQSMSPDMTRGALVICPEHPNAETLKANAEAAEQAAADEDRAEEQAEAEREAGVRMEDGTHIVGEEIESGTWVVDRSGSGCYWERIDATGETIDNNFISGSTRVEVTIQPSDYSFHSKRCGEWHLVTGGSR